MTRIIQLLFCLLIVSCISRNENGFNYLSETEVNNNSFYFPKQFLKNKDDSIVLSSVTDLIKKFGFDNLSNKPLDIETYRFTYIRAFHSPIIIKVTSDSVIVSNDYNGIDTNYVYDLSKLTKKETDIMNLWGSFQFNKITIDSKIPDSVLRKRPNIIEVKKEKQRLNDSLAKICPLIIDSIYMNHLHDKARIKKIHIHKTSIKSVPITKKDFKIIHDAFEHYKFLSMKNMDRLFIGTDGSEWILESNKKNGYYFVYRWEPNDDFRKLCDEFLKFSDLKKNEIY